MPTHAYAAVLERLGQPLCVRRIALPPLERGQVLVKIHFSGVCRSQLMEARGVRGHDPWLPHMLGHEGVGTVVSVGDGVRKVAPGEEVILGWVKGEGLDAPGARYSAGAETINSGAITTLSTYTIVAENRLVIKPANVPKDLAVLFGCAMPTGAGMVLNQLKPQPSELGLVIGLGGIGLSALITLRALGCRNVIAIDVAEDKLAFARSIGVRATFSPRTPGFLEEIKRDFPTGFDFCIESAGQTATIEMGFSLIRKHGGRMLFASHPPEGEMIRLSPHELISGKQIAGSWGGGVNPDRDIPTICGVLSDQHSVLKQLVGRHYRLAEINQALDDLEAGTVFRPLIVMDDERLDGGGA